MPESGFSLPLFSCLKRQNTGQRKPAFWYISNSVEMVQLGNGSCTATHAIFFLKNKSRQIAITNLRPRFYLLKVNDGNSRGICETCSKLTIKGKERNHWHRSSVFIVKFFKKSYILLVFQIIDSKHINIDCLAESQLSIDGGGRSTTCLEYRHELPRNFVAGSFASWNFK